MFFCKVNEQIELRLFERHHSGQLLTLFTSNREYWRPWHPLLDTMQTEAGLDRFINLGLQQFSNGGGFYAGIWFEAHLCGIIYNLGLDRLNRSAALTYWLNEKHQGKGIMTASCSAVISHAFNTLQLNRISIECATQNARSRALAERLGFKLEGIIREAEWLHDHYVDHALYGLLKSDHKISPAIK